MSSASENPSFSEISLTFSVKNSLVIEALDMF